MLILPIVNKNRILNVKVTLRQAGKVRTGVSTSEISESDIIVNGRSFSNSTFSNSKNSSVIVDFIRNNLVMDSRSYSITTKAALNSLVCDVYEVACPPIKVSDKFDELYSKVVLDMQKEVPGISKGKYLSLKRIGFDDLFSDEKVSRVRKIISNVPDSRNWMSFFKEDELVDMLQVLNLMDMFDFTVVGGASISEDMMKEILESFNKINSKDTKSLNNYYNMALENRDIYAKMSYVSKMVYDKPFNLIQSSAQRKSAQLVKSSERELNQVA